MLEPEPPHHRIQELSINFESLVTVLSDARRFEGGLQGESGV